MHTLKLAARNTTQEEKLANGYRELNKLVKRSARWDKRNWVNELANQAQTAAETNNPRILYSITRKLSARKPNTNTPIMDQHNKLQSSVNAQVKVWENHFK